MCMWVRACIYIVVKKISWSGQSSPLFPFHNFFRQAYTTRESHIYLWPDFSFVPGIFPPVQIIAFVLVGATNRYKCPLTEPRRDLIQPTQYKCASHLYRLVEADICTGPRHHPVQMWSHLYRVRKNTGTNILCLATSSWFRLYLPPISAHIHPPPLVTWLTSLSLVSNSSSS
jgi:hypothetical protein